MATTTYALITMSVPPLMIVVIDAFVATSGKQYGHTPSDIIPVNASDADCVNKRRVQQLFVMVESPTPHGGGSDDEFVPVHGSGDNPMDDGVNDADELSFLNVLVVDSPYNGVEESTDPKEITDPKNVVTCCQDKKY